MHMIQYGMLQLIDDTEHFSTVLYFNMCFPFEFFYRRRRSHRRRLTSNTFSIIVTYFAAFSFYVCCVFVFSLCIRIEFFFIFKQKGTKKTCFGPCF